MIEEKYKVAAEYVETGVEGIKRTGIKVLAMKDGYVKTLMPLEGNVNHVGMMYAGSLFTIGECMGGAIYGVAFDVKRFYPIVKEVTIRFRRPEAGKLKRTARRDIIDQAPTGEAAEAVSANGAAMSGEMRCFRQK